MSGDALRIALLTHSVNPRGGVVHALELASALHEAGSDVVVSEIEPFAECLGEHARVWADPADVDSIADALSGRRAADFAHPVPALPNRFTWEASARKHLAIYQDRLAQRAQASSAE